MRAAVLERYGAPEEFQIREIEAPDIKEGEILVRNRASSVNPVDTLVRQGKLQALSGFTSGQVIGSDFSGVVIASKSNRFKEGDEVFGVLNATNGGAYAELLVANEENAALKPININFLEAASLPMVALTAWQGMVKDGKLNRGDKVLILGCTGGVGSAAVQIAKSFGAHVTGTCSGKHADFARSLGCDKVIDYKQENVPAGEIFDLIFDASGNYSISNYKTNLAPDALFVSTRPGTSGASGAVGAATDVLFEKRMKIVLIQPNTPDLEQIKELVESGKLKPVVAKTFSFDRIRDAHSFMEYESVEGKVVIDIPDNGSPAANNYLKNQTQEKQQPSYLPELIATGFIAGMRSLSAPAVARNVVVNASKGQLYSSRLRFLESPAVSIGLKLLAATEFFADKAPAAPARIKPVSLAVRAASGALSSATVARKTRHDALTGAIAGGLAAIAATYTMYYLRTRLAKKTGLPDFALGLAEDALVIAAGVILSQSAKRK